ncbi:hypothetical protein C7437_101869 [Psychrobacillus insolitus]|uniref:EamA family transporter n=1 Tax=Psychrobacillus insolitus TaxID=1461 RepID=A0A2W7MKR6_9BACI|nr:hypothetical protein C7437_101869 [Psychrobacillus insolitus]
MKRPNIILYIFLLVTGILWGVIYWYFVAPNANL